MDEDRRDSTAALEASFAEPEDNTVPPRSWRPIEPPPPPVRAAPASAAPSAPGRPAPLPARAPDAPAQRPPAPAEETKTILLVDDEDEVRRILAERFARGGNNVVEAEDPTRP
jgi:hypothetical protein